MNKFGQKLDGHFKIRERGSTFSTEMIAGVTTFLAMAYILVVNPSTITGNLGEVANPARLAVEQRVSGDGARRVRRYAADGAACQRAVRTGARYGA